MRHYDKGTILVTTLIILLIMTTLIIQIYQTLIVMEKTISNDWFHTQKIALLNAVALKITKQSSWSPNCFTDKRKVHHDCKIDGFQYVIEAKHNGLCSVIFKNGQWRDALNFNLMVWDVNQTDTYFVRFVKPDNKLTCESPWKQLKMNIQSKSVI